MGECATLGLPSAGTTCQTKAVATGRRMRIIITAILPIDQHLGSDIQLDRSETYPCMYQGGRWLRKSYTRRASQRLGRILFAECLWTRYRSGSRTCMNSCSLHRSFDSISHGSRSENSILVGASW